MLIKKTTKQKDELDKIHKKLNEKSCLIIVQKKTERTEKFD